MDFDALQALFEIVEAPVDHDESQLDALESTLHPSVETIDSCAELRFDAIDTR